MRSRAFADRERWLQDCRQLSPFISSTDVAGVDIYPIGTGAAPSVVGDAAHHHHRGAASRKHRGARSRTNQRKHRKHRKHAPSRIIGVS